MLPCPEAYGSGRQREDEHRKAGSNFVSQALDWIPIFSVFTGHRQEDSGFSHIGQSLYTETELKPKKGRTDDRRLLFQDTWESQGSSWASIHLVLVPDTAGHGSSSRLGYGDGYPCLHCKMHYFTAVEEKDND